MFSTKGRLVTVSVAVVMAASIWNSLLEGAAGASSGPTYTIGVLTDVTGLGSTNNATTPIGVKAGIGVAEKEGFKIKYVVADTGTTPAGALTAAQKLVEEDHVFAVIGQSSVLFSAAPYLKSQGIPVIGGAEDASEWLSDPNMFSVLGYQDFTKVESTEGLLAKLLGVTNLGSIGYSISPSSTEAAKAAAISAEAAGIKVGYLNAAVPFGSTNVEPIALAMKSAGVNGVAPSVEANTAFALVTALRQLGAKLKGAMFATGYGGDLVQAGPGAKQSAQGVYFLSSYEPSEMHTAATEQIQDALKTYAGVTGDPTQGEYIGYLSVNALVTGLKAAGAHPTQASFIKAMLGIRHYTAAGLFGSHSIGFAMNQRGKAAGADNCFWVTEYLGSSFHLVRGADPICGAVIPGKTVSSS
jgi:branched-chain amino acid transport system substrate-binding protein